MQLFKVVHSVLQQMFNFTTKQKHIVIVTCFNYHLISLQNSSTTRPATTESGSFPSSKAELVQYIDMRLSDPKQDNVSVHSGHTGLSTSTAESGNSSSSSLSFESLSIEAARYRATGRRVSTPRDLKFMTRPEKRRRSDAEIVKDVEDEIQQRISKRKQQLVEKAGGAQYHSRLQERARARSTGGRLKQALTEMNNSRTTAELLKIASERRSFSTV